MGDVSFDRIGRFRLMLAWLKDGLLTGCLVWTPITPFLTNWFSYRLNFLFGSFNE